MRGLRSVLLAAVLAIGSCRSSSEEPPATTTVVFVLSTPTQRFGDVPFPSDLHFASADGGNLVADLSGLDRLVDANANVIQKGLGALDGFGRTTSAHFFVRGAVDPKSLASAAVLVDVDPKSKNKGARTVVTARALSTLDCVSVLPLPGAVLDPGVRYAFALTNAAANPSGEPLRADAALAAILALPADKRSSRAERLYGDAADVVVSSGAVPSRESIVGLAVFTTSRVSEELPKIADRVRSDPKLPPSQLLLDAKEAAPYAVALFGRTTTPNLDAWLGNPIKDETGRDFPGLDNEKGIAHDAIGAVGVGAYVSPSFLDPTTHHIERDADGSYRVADASARVPLMIVVPKDPPKNASSGYPVVVVGHGLGGHRGNMLGVANEFARAGFVSIGIDDVAHGARGGLRDTSNSFPGDYKGPDGLPDGELLGAVKFFADFTDFIAVRDNFRQTILDHVSLVKMIRSTTLDLAALGVAAGGTTPKLDADHVFWSGGSLGGIMGTMVTAMEPSIVASALQVPGGGFLHLLTANSARTHLFVEQLVRSTYKMHGDDRLDSYHPLVNLAAAIAEGGDPLVYAPYVLRAPFPFASGPRARANVLVTYAVDDELLPNIATHALLRALGIPIVDPFVLKVDAMETKKAPFSGNFPIGTGAAMQYAPANHGLGYVRWETRIYMPGHPQEALEDPYPQLEAMIKVEMPIREHAAQVTHFFQTAIDQKSAEVMVTKAPAADFDGDGVSDEDESKKGTNPYDPKSK